jgi:hypothetical protein
MFFSRKLVLVVAIFGVALGAGFVVSEVWGATSQVFQTTSGLQEIQFTDAGTDPADIIHLGTASLNLGTAGGADLTIGSAGNVGIGTTVPLGNGGDLTLGNVSALQGILYLYGSTAGKYSQIMTTDGNLHIDSGYGAGGGNGLYLNWYSGGSMQYGGGAGAAKFTVNTSGDSTFVGTVSVATPTATGHATTKSYVDSAVGAVGNHWTLSGSNLYASSTSYNVGIGTTTPAYKLDVSGQIRANITGSNAGLTVSSTGDAEVVLSAGAANNSEITFIKGGVTKWQFLTTGGNDWAIWNHNLLAFSLVVATADHRATFTGPITVSGAGNSSFVGNVGIGDASPLSLLTVGNGDLFQVNSSGVVVAGTWQGGSIATTYTAAKDTTDDSVSGTVDGSEITDNTIEEIDLEATNAPTDNYVLSYDLATGGFTWVVQSVGTGDIEGVTAGNQLTGGGTSGTVSLAVSEGAGSGLDADLLDGVSSASFQRTDASQDISAGVVQTHYNTAGETFNALSANRSITLYQPTAGADAFLTFHIGGDYAGYLGLGGAENDLIWGGWSVGNNRYRIWHQGNDGAASGLDADLLDGNSSAYFAPIASPTFTGNVTMPGSGVWNSSGNVGLGVSPATGARLDIASFLQVRSDNSASALGGPHYIRGLNGASGHLVINANASVANTATLYLNYTGDASGGGPVRIRETLIVNTDGSVNVGTSGTGKLNAGTVDPIYTIGGVRYATYVPGMTGQKEETAGTAKLKNGNYVIDFKNAEKGSDLWLFAKTANLAEEGLDNVTVLLTPSFDGRVWYEKDEAAERIVIRGGRDGEVSYRLTAPRFDHKQLPNVLEDVAVPGTENIEGFNLDKLLNYGK